MTKLYYFDKQTLHIEPALTKEKINVLLGFGWFFTLGEAKISAIDKLKKQIKRETVEFSAKIDPIEETIKIIENFQE